MILRNLSKCWREGRENSKEIETEIAENWNAPHAGHVKTHAGHVKKCLTIVDQRPRRPQGLACWADVYDAFLVESEVFFSAGCLTENLAW